MFPEPSSRIARKTSGWVPTGQQPNVLFHCTINCWLPGTPTVCVQTASDAGYVLFTVVQSSHSTAMTGTLVWRAGRREIPWSKGTNRTSKREHPVRTHKGARLGASIKPKVKPNAYALGGVVVVGKNSRSRARDVHKIEPRTKSGVAESVRTNGGRAH